MAEFPAMMLWTDAYLADTTHLRTEEHGAYLLLLMAAWRSKDCALRDDDVFLARVCRCTPERWRTKLRAVLEPFFTVAEGVWTQKRLLEEREHLQNVRSKRVAAAHAKHLKEKETAPAHAGANGVQSTTTTTTTTTTTRKKGNPDGFHLPAASPPAVRKVAGYSAEFEQLWRTYPLRDEDRSAKRDCWKVWQTAIRSNDPGALIEAAKLWHAEHHDNEFRFGLRRWLKGQMWLQPVPPRRRDQSGDFAMNAARSLMRDFTEDDPNAAEFGSVLEGARDGLSGSPAGSGAHIVPFRGRGEGDLRGDGGRAYALSAPGGDGGLSAVGAAEAWLA